MAAVTMCGGVVTSLRSAAKPPQPISSDMCSQHAVPIHPIDFAQVAFKHTCITRFMCRVSAEMTVCVMDGDMRWSLSRRGTATPRSHGTYAATVSQPRNRLPSLQLRSNTHSVHDICTEFERQRLRPGLCLHVFGLSEAATTTLCERYTMYPTPRIVHAGLRWPSLFIKHMHECV